MVYSILHYKQFNAIEFITFVLFSKHVIDDLFTRWFW